MSLTQVYTHETIKTIKIISILHPSRFLCASLKVILPRQPLIYFLPLHMRLDFLEFYISGIANVMLF